MSASVRQVSLFALCALAAACGTSAAGTDSNDDVSVIDTGGDAIDLDLGDVDFDGGTDAVDPDASTDGGGPDGIDPDDVVEDTGPIGPRPGGDDCETDSDCPRGTYCEFNFGPPYCAPVPGPDGVACRSDDDCELTDSDGVFCCSETFGFAQCTPAPGGACGDGGGGQATSCADGGQSDCADDELCLFNGEEYAYCSESCDPDRDGCPEGSYCFDAGDGFGLCVEFGEAEELSPCGADPTGCDEGLFCIEVDAERPELSFCGRGCESDDECDEGTSCTAFGLCQPNGGREAGESCTEDRFDCAEGLFCYGAGSRIAFCTDVCRRDRDCENDLICQVFDEESGNGVCVPEGDREVGEPCGDDPFACEDGFCSGGYDTWEPGAWCVATCDRDSDCPDGTVCTDSGGTGVCFPDGEGLQGADCALDPLACAEGHLCIGYGGTNAFCSELCETGADCAAGTWCTAVDPEEGGFCIPAGDIPAGSACELDTYTCAPGSYCGDTDGLCIADCTLDASVCGEDELCVTFDEEGGRSYCYPFGELGYGEACGDDVRGCAEDLYCIGRGYDVARCTALCDDDAECRDGDTCNGGVCVPAGDSGPGASCVGDPFACAEDLACLFGGAPGSFCASECTGFASACGPDDACRFIGYGRNFCVPTGDAGHGDSCAENQFACDAESWCVSAGTEDAVCVQTCSFDPESCPDGTTCRFVTGGLGVCLSAGLSPEDPLNPGGTPL